ncbi:MAG: DNA-binding protein HU-beta [Patescibacteria group bacterium]
MTKISKTQLIEMVAKSLGMTKAQVERVYESLIDSVVQHLVAGDSVALPDFGIFGVKERKAREGRNPQTGATIKIPATKAVGFRVAKKLKESVASGKKAKK